MKPPTEGIQILPEAIRAGTGALATDTSVILSTAYGGTTLTRTFLWKQLSVQFGWEGGNDGDHVILGFSRGDVTVAELTAALATAIPDPTDASNWDDFVNTGFIYWQTLHMLSTESTDSNAHVWNETIKIGGSKGIPLKKDEGVQLFAFNPSNNALNSGTVLLGTFQLKGIWLDDQ